ncbi:hypothetical protein FQA39_LY18858 [Lamprigera yunnana]|nr:hypothetical protein FQA39_LY18858 [Lamprigera yunnana]
MKHKRLALSNGISLLTCFVDDAKNASEKARRGEMDPRLEFTFQLLIDGTGLSRHEIMDHVFEGNMLDEINQLFIPHAKSKLMWFYQDMEEEPETPVDVSKPSTSRTVQTSVTRVQNPIMKKKLFLTDGWDCALTGICIYIFRLNTSKQLPEEGSLLRVIDAERIGLVTAVERIIRHVYMEALAFPSNDCEDDAANCPMVKNQLLPGLRSFCSALKEVVCEEVCGKPNVFDDGKRVVADLSMDQLKELAKQSEKVEFLQKRVKNWIKCLSDILKESDQIRRENDSSGPQDELEYWKKRGATFSQIVTKLQSQEVQLTIICLQFTRAKIVKDWRELIRSSRGSCTKFWRREGIVVAKPYDYLDQRNGEFDADFETFMNQLEVLKREIANTIEKNFENVGKHRKYCEKEVSRIVTMYKKEKDDPPLCRLFPPFAGRIKWSRSLGRHLAELWTTSPPTPF